MHDAIPWLVRLRDRRATSLFLVPLVAVLVAVVAAGASLLLDGHLDGSQLPLVLDSTVTSSRTVLQVVAGATIAFAGVAFSISMLTVQQASAQYSPRVIEAIFRDPFNRRVMGLVVGTFTFALVVLRSVRSAIDDGGDPVVPIVSVTVALVLGIVTILAVVGFIDHNARSMDISTILGRITRTSLARFDDEWTPARPDGPAAEPLPLPTEAPHVVTAASGGWVQDVDVDRLLDLLPPGGTAWVHVWPGRFAVTATPLVTLSFAPLDPDAFDARARGCVAIGGSRSSERDVTFGLRQLSDISLRALSTGINDPTTAQDAIFRSADVLAGALRRDPPHPRRAGPAGRRAVLLAQPDHHELLHVAFSEVTRAAAPQPAVGHYLLEAMAALHATLRDGGWVERAAAVERQAADVVRHGDAGNPAGPDREALRRRYDELFGTAGTGSPDGAVGSAAGRRG